MASGWWLEQNSGGASPTIQISVVGDPTTSAIVITRTEPAVGTLDSWDLEFKESTASTWTSYATGITAETQTVADLDAETDYDFQAKGHVSLDTEYATVSATTAESVVPVATASLWYGANWEVLANPLTEVRSYQGDIINNTGTEWRTIAPLFASYSSVPGQILGWRIRNNNNATAWTYGTISGSASFTPTAGGNDPVTADPILADAATLLNYVPNGGRLIIQVALAAGNHAAGKMSAASLPTTMVTSSRSGAGQNAIAGDSMTWNSGYSMPFTHLFIGTDPAGRKTRKIMYTGDSLTAQVIPIADVPNTAREGYAIKASKTAADANEGFQIVSFGRGTYTLAQMEQSQAKLAGVLGAAHFDWAIPQGWSFNASPTSQSDLDARIASTQAVADLWSPKGVRVGVNFMSPAGASRNTETYLPWYTGAVSYWTGRVPVVNLAASVADGGDPTIIAPAYSQDGVHVNAAGATPHGTAAYTQTKEILVAGGEL